MWHHVERMGHPINLELTCKSLQSLLANYYTTRRAKKKNNIQCNEISPSKNYELVYQFYLVFFYKLKLHISKSLLGLTQNDMYIKRLSLFLRRFKGLIIK